MAKLVPDGRRTEAVVYHCCSSHNPRVPMRGPVTNILLWVECHSSLVAVLSSKYPQQDRAFYGVSKNHNRGTPFICWRGMGRLRHLLPKKGGQYEEPTREKQTTSSTMRFLQAKPRSSTGVASVSVSYTPPQNVLSLQALALQPNSKHHQDGIVVKRRQSLSAFCTMIRKETGARTPQLASMGIPAQPAREDTPTLFQMPTKAQLPIHNQGSP